MTTARYLDTLFWYDRPILFTVKIEGRGLGLAMLVEEYEHPTLINGVGGPALCDRYLIVETSPRRMQAVLNNCTTLREAFKFPEAPGRWHWLADDAKLDVGGTQWILEVHTGAVGDDWLAAKGARVYVGEQKQRRPRRVLTRRERLRKEWRRQRGIERRPQRSWALSLWQANQRIQAANRAHLAET